MNYEKSEKDKKEEPFCIRAKEDKYFKDRWSRREKVTTSTGSEVEKTYYSDGSTTEHGVMGDRDTDKFGNPC